MATAYTPLPRGVPPPDYVLLASPPATSQQRARFRAAMAGQPDVDPALARLLAFHATAERILALLREDAS